MRVVKWEPIHARYWHLSGDIQKPTSTNCFNAKRLNKESGHETLQRIVHFFG